MSHWETIRNNARKVPCIPLAYLEADVSGYANWITDKSYEVVEPLHLRSHFAQRMALLRIVDAIESSGLARFDRTMAPGDYWWQGVYQSWDDYNCNYYDQHIKAHNDHEHLALLECVAGTMEALPEPAATS